MTFISEPVDLSFNANQQEWLARQFQSLQNELLTMQASYEARIKGIEARIVELEAWKGIAAYIENRTGLPTPAAEPGRIWMNQNAGGDGALNYYGPDVDSAVTTPQWRRVQTKVWP